MELLDLLKQEYSKSYSVHQTTVPFEAMCELFLYVIDSDPSLQATLRPALEYVALERDNQSLTNIILSFEHFAKYVVDLTHQNGWQSLPTHHAAAGVMLTDVLQHFGLRTKPWARQAVELRNKPAHHLPDLLATLTLRQYATYLEEALLGYFLVTAVRYQALYKQRWDAYLRKVIALYENRQATFVDLQVKEQIRLIGVEVKAVGDMSASRKVAVLELRQKVEEKARLLLGNAGMGKTTTLLHLAHRDATQLLAAPTLSTPIPVLVDLAKWTLLEQTIEQYIAQATNEPLHRIQRDFAAARYVLYVDGFNEIQNVQGLEQWLLTNLQTLIQNYPELEIIIASRPTKFEDLTLKMHNQRLVPAFRIEQMEGNLVKDFILKNYNQSKSEKQTLWQKIETNKDLLRILGTPFYLVAFLKGYERNPVLPTSDVAIVDTFIQEKYRRERELDKAFDSTSFQRVIGKYAVKVTNELGQSNPPVPQDDVWAILMGILNEDISAVEKHLNHALSMHLLTNENLAKTYRFAHQNYQSYFKVKADKSSNLTQRWKNK